MVLLMHDNLLHVESLRIYFPEMLLCFPSNKHNLMHSHIQMQVDLSKYLNINIDKQLRKYSKVSSHQ